MAIDREKLDSIFKPDTEAMDPEDAELEESILQKPVGILLQRSPDPDCLGAAAGVALILQEVYGLSSKIYHYGEVSHPQNKSMVNVLHIDLINGAEFNPDEVCRTIVLDTDLTSTGFKQNGLGRVDVRIDHHSMERDEAPALRDVRPVGATCSIVWDYLKEMDMGEQLKEHPEVATALVLGIKTDTLDFTSSNTAELDMEAFRSLLPFVDKAALAKLTKYVIPKIQFDIESKAFAAKDIREGVLVSCIGETNEHNRDIIATIADKFARMETISTVIILGFIDDNVIASVRSDDTRVNVAKLCADVFGKQFSGAKEGSGGAKIPLGAGFSFIGDEETKDKVMTEIVSSLKEKVFGFFGDK